MGQVLHPRAKTTHEVRAAIQKSEKALAEVAKEYGINIKTAHKWRNRTTVEDSPMGTKQVMRKTLNNMALEFILGRCLVSFMPNILIGPTLATCANIRP